MWDIRISSPDKKNEKLNMHYFFGHMIQTLRIDKKGMESRKIYLNQRPTMYISGKKTKGDQISSEKDGNIKRRLVVASLAGP